MSAIVVTDAGPLHYLVLIDCADILPIFFERVLVPFAVRDELLYAGAPKKVRNWLIQPRAWIEITSVAKVQPVRGLHKGETEALQLALERKAGAVLIDDRDGRAAAHRLGLTPIYTVAILELAAEKSLVELPIAIAKLKQTSFFISQEILDAALQRDKERKEKEKQK